MVGHGALAWFAKGKNWEEGAELTARLQLLSEKGTACVLAIRDGQRGALNKPYKLLRVCQNGPMRATEDQFSRGLRTSQRLLHGPQNFAIARPIRLMESKRYVLSFRMAFGIKDGPRRSIAQPIKRMRPLRRFRGPSNITSSKGRRKPARAAAFSQARTEK